MKKWRVFIVLFILITPSAFAGNAKPQFKDYPANEVYTGKNHPLVLDEFGKSYRTRLREAIRNNKPDFAGHYIVVKWTIGPLVVYNAGAVIDAKTGRAYSFPVATGSAFSEKEVDYFQDHLYKLNSRLMVFAGNLVGSEEYTGENTVAFYEFKDNKFILIKTAPYK